MLLAFHNKETLKTETVEAMKADIQAEKLAAGHYWNGKTGCFVGCVIRGSQHSKFEDVLGIPRILARLGDCLFEGLWKFCSHEEARKFTIDFLESIPTGADLSSCWPKFAVFMLADKEHGVLQYAKTDKTKKAIENVVDLYRRMINGEKISTEQWKEVRKIASAAASAYASASASAARSRRYTALATYLLQTFREAAHKKAA